MVITRNATTSTALRNYVSFAQLTGISKQWVRSPSQHTEYSQNITDRFVGPVIQNELFNHSSSCTHYKDDSLVTTFFLHTHTLLPLRTFNNRRIHTIRDRFTYVTSYRSSSFCGYYCCRKIHGLVISNSLILRSFNEKRDWCSDCCLIRELCVTCYEEKSRTVLPRYDLCDLRYFAIYTHLLILF